MSERVSVHKVNALLRSINAPIDNAVDMRYLVALLAEEENLTAFQGFFDSLRGCKPVIQRRSPFAKQAEVFRERMFEIDFFRACCSYGERRVMAKAEFNFATPGPLNALISHPFGDDAESVWKSIFECVVRIKGVTSEKRKSEEVTGENIGNLTKKAVIEAEDAVKVWGNSAKKATEISTFDSYFGPSGGRSEPGVCGMRNFTGSICFLNAVLQCLAHINAMRDAFAANFGAQQLNL